MIKGGYQGKILRVDLTQAKLTTEPIPHEKILKKYIGNFGLGLWYLTKELPAGITPLEPGNPLIFMNAPLVATRIPASNNCTLATYNGDTGFTAGRAHSHGWFGPYLAMAGYDGLIITGASDKWVYLWIDNDEVELRDATKLIGKDTHETEDLVKEDLGIPVKTGAAEGASVAAIGPAGENRVTGASIMNDKNHGFCHSSSGAIMGSKNLKAIAVRGTGKVRLADESKFNAIVKEWMDVVTKTGIAQYIANAAVPRTDYADVKGLIGLSVKNWLSNDLPGFGDRMSKQNVTTKPCYRCPIGCSYNVELVEGPYKGYVATLSGGGENMEGAAAIVGAGKECGEAFYLTDTFDRLGVETSTVGCSMAVAFEAYEKELLTKEDTDGLELKWGDVKVIETLLRRIVHREGKFANMLADGPKAAAERVGLPNAGVHVKGAGMNLHDWRRGWGPLLGQIMGGGAGWTPPGLDTWSIEPDIGYNELSDRLKPADKGMEVAKSGRMKFWNDCYGVCWFSSWGKVGILRMSSGAICAAVGWDDFGPEEALAVGHRVITLERIFNMQHGLTAEDDIKVSPRLIEPAPADAGEAAGLSIGPYLEGWARDYYEELGWERKTGKPLMATLKKLGMEEFMDTVWG